MRAFPPFVPSACRLASASMIPGRYALSHPCSAYFAYFASSASSASFFSSLARFLSICLYFLPPPPALAKPISAPCGVVISRYLALTLSLAWLRSPADTTFQPRYLVRKTQPPSQTGLRVSTEYWHCHSARISPAATRSHSFCALCLVPCSLVLSCSNRNLGLLFLLILSSSIVISFQPLSISLSFSLPRSLSLSFSLPPLTSPLSPLTSSSSYHHTPSVHPSTIPHNGCISHRSGREDGARSRG